MIKKLTQKIMSVLIERGVISNDAVSVEHYKKKIERMVETVIAIIYVVVISLFLNCLLEGMIFIVLFVSLHYVTGGYNFQDPEFRCVGISLCYVAVHFFANHVADIGTPAVIIILGVDILLVLVHCPTKYIRQKGNCRKILRKISALVSLTFVSALCLVLRKINSSFSPLIFYTVQTNIAYMMAANIAVDINKKHLK